MKLIGPFTQLLPLSNLPERGPIADDALVCITNAGLLIENGKIVAIDLYTKLLHNTKGAAIEHHELKGNFVCLPGFIDAHTHICFGGSRARDYAMRNAGKTYLEIAQNGGGIWDTVTETRNATTEILIANTIQRAQQHLTQGTTTMEVKSGYGLSVNEELKMLRAIKKANAISKTDLITTCLAAHMVPKDFAGTASEYLSHITTSLLPKLKTEKLTNRIDAFVEQSAFSSSEITPYLIQAAQLDFDITVHADQFSTGGSSVAIACNALSADHLEASTPKEIKALAKSNVIGIALPGASLGLGCGFTPARKLLDAGGKLAIASDHNPGSAPMGNLLAQAAILGAFEKLTNAEVLAGITVRAAAALNLKDRGTLEKDKKADFTLFETSHYNEILYQQGSLTPAMVFKNGSLVFKKNNT